MSANPIRAEVDAARQAGESQPRIGVRVLEELADERDRLEAALADERRQRAEVYRQHTGLTAELDRATTDRDRAARHLSDARSTISRLEVDRIGADRRLALRTEQRDGLQARVTAALEILDELGTDGADDDTVATLLDVLRGHAL